MSLTTAYLVRRVSVALVVIGAAACASARPALLSANNAPAAVAPDQPCERCVDAQPDSLVMHAIEKRVSDLKARGGNCSMYAAILETSLRSGQITIRPYMWRVGDQLASGEAKPNGEMVLAREIDSLNVGVRTIDDVLWSVEHEAAHIAFKISNGLTEDRANNYVRACKS